MNRILSYLPFSMHRTIIFGILRWLLRTKRPTPAYSPVPRRILYVAASCLPYHISGYTTRTHELLCALRANGGDVRVVTRTGYPWDRRDSLCLPEGESTTRDNITYAHTPAPRNNRFTAIYAAQAAAVIEQYAVQERIAVIHAASNHVNALPALIAARRLGIPFQYEMRGLWELTRASRQPAFENSHNYTLGLELEALVTHNADKIFVISERLGRYLTEHWAIPQERIFLLPNCVDPERLSPAEGAPARPTAIVYAGSLIGYEGLDVLINAVDLLSARGRAVLVYIAGDGEERTALEEQVRSLTLSHQIRFLGKVSPKSACELVREAVFVCIPRRPFRVCKLVPPIKLVEALALGKPVIVPDMPLFHDELGDSGAGFFFRPGDPLDLAETIVRLLDDDALRENAGCRARAYAAAHRNWQHFIPAIID